jgi:hypothetical protein
MPLDWNLLFPPGEPVIALPSWRHPRLLLSARRLEHRWRDSDFYRAQRIRAKIFKQMLRLRAAAKLAQVRRARGSAWILPEFLRGLVDSPQPPSIWIGTPCSSQKWTIQVTDADGKVAAYVKWGCSESACRRIVHEHAILCALPKDLGPQPLRMGLLDDAMALCLRPVNGRALRRHAAGTSARLANLLAGLVTHEPLPIDEHPGFTDLATDAPLPVLTWIEQLSDQSWPVVIRHGDLAPWNLVEALDQHDGSEGRLIALDWEYASLSGISLLDAAYYHLQIAGLLKKLSPQRAVALTMRRLMREPWPALSHRHAEALTALTAYAAWRRAVCDGDAADEQRPRWHRAIWDRQPTIQRGNSPSATTIRALVPSTVKPAIPWSGVKENRIHS